MTKAKGERKRETEEKLNICKGNEVRSVTREGRNRDKRA